jgi:uncharacterized protein (DUF1800 family)
MVEPTPPSLDKVDPAQAWQPWKPDDKQPWNLKWAGHLFRRAGFGADLVQLNKAIDHGFKTTLDNVLNGGKDDYDFYDKEFNLSGVENTVGTKLAESNNAYDLRGWWLQVLWYSPYPLREKMTLFWHNHFVSSIAKVRSGVKMYNQNKVLRRFALGKFPAFLLKVSKDPAMLDYLDSNSNINGKPNENYAREVMELFSLGVGNYTEKDVQEAARAFTGWHTNGSESRPAFEFNKNYHDFGTKTILGQKGEWSGDDVVRIIVEQKACAPFLVRKFYRFFISENADPPDALLSPLADSFRKSGYDIAEVVGTILRSRHFFSEHAYRQRVKNPVEFALGAAKVMGNVVNPRALVSRIDDMGQQLFGPPNVKGWPGGKSWLNTSTVLARHNFAQALCSGTSDINKGSAERLERGAAIVDPSAHFKQQKITEPEKILDTLANIVFQDELGAKTRNRLLSFLKDGEPKAAVFDQRVGETIHAMMCMPEFQLA